MATGNFTLSRNGYPTYALMAFDWILENMHYELEGLDIDYEDWDAIEKAEQEVFNRYESTWRALPEFKDVEKAVEEANYEIKQFINNTPLTREKELEREGTDEWLEEDYEGWTLYDKLYDDEYPEINIESGYYEGASIVIKGTDEDYIDIYELGDGIVEIMDKHFGEQGLGLGQLNVAYRFSNGETGYTIK